MSFWKTLLLTVLLLTVSMLTVALASGAPLEPAGLTIRITNPAPAGGELVIALFDSAEAFERRSGSLRSTILPVDDKETLEWRVDDLSPGEYTAVVFQDLDGDRVLDKGRLGIPKEPYGFSNDARSTFGPPPYEQARFRYDGTRGEIEIRLRRR